MGFTQFYLYMTPCHSAVQSKQEITDTRKYDSCDELSVLDWYVMAILHHH